MKSSASAKFLVWLIILSAALGAGCVKVRIPEGEKGPVSLSEITTATSVSAAGQPLSVANSFSAATPVIYVCARVNNAPENTTVAVKWVYFGGEGGTISEQVISEDSLNVRGTSYIAFKLSPPSGLWEPGRYSVLLYLNNAEIATTSFSVTAVQKADAPAPTVSYFRAFPESISTGQAVTLSWSTMGADTVTIAGLGNVPPVGNKIVLPVNSREYILTAVNKAGSTTVKVSITVTSFISDKPDLTITDFWVEGDRAYYKIKNIGQTRVIPETYTNPNAKPSLTYLYIEGNYRDSSRVEVLAPGEERTLYFPNYQWPYGTERRYSIPIRICADGQNLIGEYDKNNNCLVLDW